METVRLFSETTTHSPPSCFGCFLLDSTPEGAKDEKAKQVFEVPAKRPASQGLGHAADLYMGHEDGLKPRAKEIRCPIWTVLFDMPTHIGGGRVFSWAKSWDACDDVLRRH